MFVFHPLAAATRDRLIAAGLDPDDEYYALDGASRRTRRPPARSGRMLADGNARAVSALLKAGEDSILSDRGRVNIDERTNTLLIRETREVIENVRALVAQLDIPVKQVLIESRIVIANNDYSRELGARFGVSAVGRNGNNGLVTTSGSANATPNAAR